MGGSQKVHINKYFLEAAWHLANQLSHSCTLRGYIFETCVVYANTRRSFVQRRQGRTQMTLSRALGGCCIFYYEFTSQPPCPQWTGFLNTINTKAADEGWKFSRTHLWNSVHPRYTNNKTPKRMNEYVPTLHYGSFWLSNLSGVNNAWRVQMQAVNLPPGLQKHRYVRFLSD